MTHRGLGVTASVVVLWAVARAFAIPELQMAAVGCLTLLASALLWAALLPMRVTVERTVTPGALWFDHATTVRLTVQNTGRFSTTHLTVRDGVPRALGGSVTSGLPPLGSGARATVTYALRGSRRGRFVLGPVTLRCQDPFGLVERSRTLEAAGTVTVYPPVWQLPDGLPLGGATTTGVTGRRQRTSSGDELADIREYVRGDDLRSVHWASTAHQGKLMVRRSESATSPGSVVLLDRRADRHLGQGASSSFETAVAAAASAGYHLASRGRSVILLDGPVVGPPRALPWEAWLERLAATNPEAVDLASLLRQVGDGVAGDGTLIAIFTVPEAAELRALVRAGRAFSIQVALIVDVEGHTSSPDPAAELAVSRLRAAGWRATALTRGDRLDDRWRELVASRRTGPRPVTTSPPRPSTSGVG